MGDGLLVAPIIVSERNRAEARRSPPAESETAGGEAGRSVYLPPGDWQDFWTHEKYHGGQEIEVRVPLEHIPLFIPSGTVLPLAQPTLHTDDPDSWHLTALIYGDGHRSAILYEDDGSYLPSLNPVTVSWNNDTKSGTVSRAGASGPATYDVVAWKQE